eukprot:9585390-Alexandrium_andersonii.AAC.1
MVPGSSASPSIASCSPLLAPSSGASGTLASIGSAVVMEGETEPPTSAHLASCLTPSGAPGSPSSSNAPARSVEFGPSS